MRREIIHAFEIARHYGPIAGTWIAREAAVAVAIALSVSGIVMGTAALMLAVTR